MKFDQIFLPCRVLSTLQHIKFSFIEQVLQVTLDMLVYLVRKSKKGRKRESLRIYDSKEPKHLNRTKYFVLQ